MRFSIHQFRVLAVGAMCGCSFGVSAQQLRTETIDDVMKPNVKLNLLRR